MNRKSGIFIELSGGVGNQLFMYFAGLSLALRLGVDLVCSRKIDDKAENLHPGSIESLDLLCIWDQAKLNISEITTQERIQRRLSRMDSTILNFLLPNFKYFESATIGYDSRIYRLKAGSSLRGYFQSFRYYEDCKRFVDASSILKLRNPSQKYLSLRNEFRTGNICAVHVRRQDYRFHQNTIGKLSATYYLNALSKLNDVMDIDQFYVFSDDAKESKDLLSNILPTNTIWAEDLEDLNPIETLILMSSAKAIIAANSSYSASAAIIANEGTQVFAPDQWFIGQEDPVGLIPSHWFTVPR